MKRFDGLQNVKSGVGGADHLFVIVSYKQTLASQQQPAECSAEKKTRPRPQRLRHERFFTATNTTTEQKRATPLWAGRISQSIGQLESGRQEMAQRVQRGPHY